MYILCRDAVYYVEKINVGLEFGSDVHTTAVDISVRTPFLIISVDYICW
jgi:hypothetical protein